MRVLVAVDRKERGIEIIRVPMRYQIQLSAEGLKNIAGAFKGISDPCCIVTLASTDEEIGKTESVKNCLDPTWAEICVLEHPDDEANSNIFIEVRIFDDNRDKEDKLMAKAMVNLKDAIDGPEQSVEADLEDGGILKVRAVPSIMNNSLLKFQLRALDVKNIEKGALGLGRTDPYVEIKKKYSYPASGSYYYQTVYRSVVIDNHLNPFWEEAEVNLERFCDGNLDMALQISIWDYGSKKRTLIGILETTARGLLGAVSEEGNADRALALEFRKPSEFTTKTTRKVGDLIVVKATLEDD